MFICKGVLDFLHTNDVLMFALGYSVLLSEFISIDVSGILSKI